MTQLKSHVRAALLDDIKNNPYKYSLSFKATEIKYLMFKDFPVVGCLKCFHSNDQTVFEWIDIVLV